MPIHNHQNLLHTGSTIAPCRAPSHRYVSTSLEPLEAPYEPRGPPNTCETPLRQEFYNWSIRKIFLYNASYLIFIGLFWGNLAGLTLLFIQKYGGFITLDPATYYVSEVPVSINLLSIVLLNIGTLIVCFVMLIIPSIIITKIEPSKSIKFA